ncbi:biopolymer transporter ExbD [Lacihabitans sp. CCS-44]|jgi:biopolymer transport protein ExbD|uniref:ExbD/TolR family protein n=1 Tax=Lacihabitans sp. CCS-44 TaxID=2487331 RepID=UPI0020CE84D5|nr:biopolymer transporter ExbD [Lacihabitans sp. CCS-44]MCP9754824.1 biopolymer transporter ExbD [Lacihabitans sp. CCS-44]
MAEIQEKDSGKGGKVRSKKNSGKPDMTPMVDLGFLLITFFMFTTTFSKPNMMKLNMPEKDEDAAEPETSEIKLSNTISIVMGKDDRIFWYQQAVSDVTAADFKETDYSATGIRAEIQKRKLAAIDSTKFTVILKPTKEATFKNTVDILDEMEITGNKLYAIVDLQKQEEDAYNEKMKTPKGGN